MVDDYYAGFRKFGDEYVKQMWDFGFLMSYGLSVVSMCDPDAPASELEKQCLAVMLQSRTNDFSRFEEAKAVLPLEYTASLGGKLLTFPVLVKKLGISKRHF